MQKLVYCINQVLRDVEIRYSKVEKLVYTLVTSSRRLYPYFQVHLIIVLTDQPWQQILHNLMNRGRMVEWTIKLEEFNIFYQARPAIKA